ncbi:hypothetical protein GF378_01425 [Candidatus Pacearchaeota archaeon]|nr:hypothetical protein [Candidatus Pacearchaeota archaeon]
MNISVRKGLGFGLTSGIITTLGLLVGLNAGTHSKQVVLGGILVVAIADALSDALGMHVSEEAGSKTTTNKQIWSSTFSTTFFKFLFALSFAVPVLIFDLSTAVLVSIVWGILLLSSFSYAVAKKREQNPFYSVFEHVAIAIVVIVLTYFIGNWVSTWAV